MEGFDPEIFKAVENNSNLKEFLIVTCYEYFIWSGYL